MVRVACTTSLDGKGDDSADAQPRGVDVLRVTRLCSSLLDEI